MKVCHKVLINDISIAFVNLCPHPINVGDNLIIPESKWIARKVSPGGSSYTKSHTDVLDFGDLEVRRMKELVYVKPLNKVGKLPFPPEVENTFFIVSSLTASYLGHRKDILVPDDKNTKKGKVIRGLLAFNKETYKELERLLCK